MTALFKSLRICLYQTDVGIYCTNFVQDGRMYCPVHEHTMAEINRLEHEINETIRKAREK